MFFRKKFVVASKCTQFFLAVNIALSFGGEWDIVGTNVDTMNVIKASITNVIL
jgi:hypothetical protein